MRRSMFESLRTMGHKVRRSPRLFALSFPKMTTLDKPYAFSRMRTALILLFAEIGMGRGRKGSDFGLLEAIAGMIAVGFALVYLKDPVAGRALFQLGPWLILTVAVVGAAVLFVFALVSRISLPNAGATESNDFARRVSTASPEVAAPRFPKVEADRQRERILTLEEKLDRLDWFQFEKVVAMLYSSRGCKVERRGGANPDGGIDLVVDSGQSRFAVQCKFWKANEVGVLQVRELMGALQDTRIPKGVIVSIKGFSGAARELAARNGIELAREISSCPDAERGEIHGAYPGAESDHGQRREVLPALRTRHGPPNLQQRREQILGLFELSSL